MQQNEWYIGCASAQLEKEPYSAQIGGKRLVLYRDSDGIAHALRDRCCHRGLPLSKGKVREGTLTCGFHGWGYDGSGKCINIPSQPEKPVPQTYRVESYPCHEKDGYVWVWMGEGEQKPAPAIAEFSSGRWIQGFRIVRCHFLRALEITFDSMHVYYAHPDHPATIQAQKHGYAPMAFEFRGTDRGCLLFSPPTESASSPLPDTGTLMEFQLPGRIRFQWDLPGTAPMYMYWNAQPVTENTCRMDWLITNPGPSEKRLLWTEGGREIIEEDQIILEAIERSYEEEGESFERSVEADIPTLTLRRIVKAYEKGAWPSEKTSIPPRRIISIPGPASWG